MSFGGCYYPASGPSCGEKTGFYVTLVRGLSVLTNFRFRTGGDLPGRDPISITIEGSNQSGTALTLGSSWTQIYSGASGLISDPGRLELGSMQSISNYNSFSSYRLLVTSHRASSHGTQYSEMEFYGY